MRAYYARKMVLAKPMTRGEFNSMRGWPLPVDAQADEEGYLVVHGDGASNTELYDGYVCWSPKNMFEDHYVTRDI